MGCTQSSGAAELQNDDLVANFLEPPKQEGFTKSAPSFKTKKAAPPPASSRQIPGVSKPVNTVVRNSADLPVQEAFTRSEPTFRNATPPQPQRKTQRGTPSPGFVQNTYKPPGGSDRGVKQNTYKPPVSSEHLATEWKPMRSPASADKPVRRSEEAKKTQRNARKSPRATAKKNSGSSEAASKNAPPRKPQPEAAPDEPGVKPKYRVEAGPSRPDVPQRKVREESVYVEQAKEGQTFDQVYSAGKDVSFSVGNTSRPNATMV